MRKAAGIVLIIFGALGVIGLVRLLTGLVNTLSFIRISMVPSILLQIVPIAFYVVGGVFCLWREYWRVCLASASFAVFIGVFGVVLFSWIDWTVWVPLVAAVIAVILILSKKREWQEISDSVDGKVSYGG